MIMRTLLNVTFIYTLRVVVFGEAVLKYKRKFAIGCGYGIFYFSFIFFYYFLYNLQILYALTSVRSEGKFFSPPVCLYP